MGARTRRGFLRPGHELRAALDSLGLDVALDQVVHRSLLCMPQTLVMICHRLVHVGGFDRVLMLDAGSVVEDGAPEQLMSSPDSRLRAMWNQLQG